MLKRWVSVGILGLAAQIGVISAWAGSGADALLRSVVTAPGAAREGAVDSGPTNPMASVVLGGEIKLSDPFLMQLFSSWQAETGQSASGMSYDLNSWVMRVLKADYKGAAHLWSSVSSKLPASFEITGQAAYAYLLWKLDLPQTFMDQWTRLLSNPRYMESRISTAFDQTLVQGFDQWLLSRTVHFTPEQAQVIQAIPLSKGLVYTYLHAWTRLRSGDAGLAALEALPANSALKIPLGQSVALAFARKSDLASAGKVLKKHLEPAIEASRSPERLASHYLQVARLLYQAGALDGAEEFYQKVPSGAADFLSAREELTWVWLRQGKIDRLRGELVTLGTKWFDEQFSPELHLVKAISNLKMCFYDQVEKDFKNFIERNAAWAGKISAAVKAENPPAPRSIDFFSKLATDSLAKREDELEKLKAMGHESITASLPAVGPQTHWVNAQNQMISTLESLKKSRSYEYRRQWKNQQASLTEAIRKMQFVKVEYMSQVRDFAQLEAGGHIGDSIQVTSAAPRDSRALDSAKGDIVFPFDGVIWADEMFKLRSVAQGKCMKGAAQ